MIFYNITVFIVFSDQVNVALVHIQGDLKKKIIINILTDFKILNGSV